LERGARGNFRGYPPEKSPSIPLFQRGGGSNHATHKKEIDMNHFVDVKTAAKLLQDQIFVALISSLIALVGIVGFTAAKKAPGAISN
jgi:hypothetical protein